MNPQCLEQVLSCSRLPTIPAIAARIVELTRDEDVDVRELGEVIQNDQALSAKVLKTVNSSLFGLSKPCSSISHAIVLLGLDAVRSIALGFSLAGAIKGQCTGGIDLTKFWKRSLMSAVAAKNAAARTNLAAPETAFLAALLQDIGVIALLESLGEKYAKILEETGDDHRRLGRMELNLLEIQHPIVGAMLATRWRLPEELVVPIKFHERPTAAPSEFAELSRLVGFANIVADMLSSEDPSKELQRLYQTGMSWFGFKNVRVDEIVRGARADTMELAKLLEVPVGEVNDGDRVLEAARARLAEMPILVSPVSIGTDFDTEGTDALTGATVRERFDQLVVALFEQATGSEQDLTLAIFEPDGFEEISERYGREAGDTVLISMVGRIESAVSGEVSSIARYDDSRFAVMLPKQGRAGAAQLIDRVLKSFVDHEVPLIAANPGSPRTIPVTLSVGVVTLDQSTRGCYTDAERFVVLAEKALSAAKKAGNGSVRIHQPTAMAA